MDLFPNDRLPIVAETTLRAHKVAVPYDTRFRACARLLQALWRERQGLPVGAYTTQSGRRRKLGSRLPETAARDGANFISPEVHRLARRELAYREPGAHLDEERLYGNLLSSMPLAFNLFGPLKLDRDLAESVVSAICPELAGPVSAVWFEHSPGRGDPTFTDDGTTFDVFISMRREGDGAKTFLAFEIKYAENMGEPEPRLRPRYDELSRTCGLFIDPDSPDLRRNPQQQLWREHILAQSMIDAGLYDAGALIVVSPKLNTDVERAVALYRQNTTDSDDRAAFKAIHLETLIAAIEVGGAPKEAQVLHKRYCDFAPVHAVI